MTNKSDLRSQITTLKASLAAGLRLSEAWSLGWTLALAQTQNSTSNVSSTDDGSLRSLRYEDTTLKDQDFIASMGTMFDIPYFRLGLEVSSVPHRVSHSGLTRTRLISTQTNLLQETQVDTDTPDNTLWNGSVGVRLGGERNGFLIADDYSSGGRHEGTLAFEHNWGWGSFTTGLNHGNYKGLSTVAFNAGYIQRSANFDWGVGPSFAQSTSNNPGAVNSKSYNLLYSSEIRF